MGQTVGNTPGRAARLFCFTVLATVGMASVGLTFLAQPLAGYYADKTLIDAQQRQLEALGKLHRQQEELLANAEKASVVERAAINNLCYVPCELAKNQQQNKLPPTWPALEKALSEITKPPLAAEPGWQQQFTEKLAQQPKRRVVLGVFGSVLVIISLAFFYRQR